MYLQKLYRYNKWLFTGIVFFVAMQLFVTYKRGMVISPWYNYGMYSEKIFPKPLYQVNYQLTDAKCLYIIAPQYDDKINLTLDQYRKLPKNDSLYQKEIMRIYAKFHLPVPAARFYQTAFSKTDFDKWFRQYVHPSVSSPLQATDTIALQAIWNGSELKLP